MWAAELVVVTGQVILGLVVLVIFVTGWAAVFKLFQMATDLRTLTIIVKRWSMATFEVDAKEMRDVVAEVLGTKEDPSCEN